MSMQTDLEVFERTAEAKGRLLRIEGDRAGATPRQLVLTFDVGRILIRPTDDGLSASRIEERTALPGDLISLDEEEPWWRLLGQPLTAAWPGGNEEAAGAQGSGALLALNLQFRDEAENPCVVMLESAGSAIRISLGV